MGSHDATVCLVRARAGEAFRFSAQSLCLPLGLAYVAAAVEASGRGVRVIDAVGGAPRKHTRYFKGYLIGLSDEEVVRAIPSESRVVGISVPFTHEWPAVVRLLVAIRAARSDVVLVLGGEHVTALPGFCLATSQADVLVLGEGEQTMVELLDALEAGGDLAAVDGIAFRRDGEVVSNPRRARRLDIDALPRPAWHHFDVHAYHDAGYVGGVVTGRLTLPLLATRGCPYRCTYCTNPNMWTTRWVARDPLAVVDEMVDGMQRYGASNFPLQDLTAIVRRDWVVTFCEEILRRDLDLLWQMPTGTRVEAVDAEVADLMRRSGMIGMAYAPESGSATTRERIRKQMDGEALLASIRAASGAGLNVAVFLVAGFPHDTRQTLRESLAFVDDLVAAGATEVSSGFYMCLPGTELFEQQCAAGDVRLDRAFFGQVLQSTELFPSVSWCAAVGRLGLALWTYNLYLRFFRADFLASLRQGRLSSARRAVSGRFTGSKWPDALRYAARAAWITLRTRLGPRWMPAPEEERLFAGFAAAHARRSQDGYHG